MEYRDHRERKGPLESRAHEALQVYQVQVHLERKEYQDLRECEV